MVLLGQGVLVIASVSIATLLLSCLIQFYFLNRVQPLRVEFNWQLAKWMVRASLPYFLSSVFLIVYAEISMVTVSLLTDETGVGWYGTASRLLLRVTKVA
jgi:O-antigen/teichoic acid export membrane protein